VCAAAVLAVALLKPAVVASTGERLRRGVTLEDRLSRRLDVWRVARGIGREHPLTGVGLGNFRRQYAVHAAITPGMTDPYSAAEALEPHSVIIGTLAELGPGGLLLLLAFAVSVAGSARKAAGSPGAAWASVVGALAATTVVGLADDVLAKKATWSVLALATDTRAEPGGRPGGET
jgi:O-antigen ligase